MPPGPFAELAGGRLLVKIRKVHQAERLPAALHCLAGYDFGGERRKSDVEDAGVRSSREPSTRTASL